ncbi:flagellar transcriptional activator FlhD, partial [Enterobacter hormaechei]|nr:flagellar transcriptional activator FlhD [Enterobacter hormaechei]
DLQQIHTGILLSTHLFRQLSAQDDTSIKKRA